MLFGVPSRTQSKLIFSCPLVRRSEGLYLAADLCGGTSETVNKSVEDGVEADIFGDMPDEAIDFLIKFHNGFEDKRDIVSMLKEAPHVSFISFRQ
jgi:uncharacterized protein (DUF2384 family)